MNLNILAERLNSNYFKVYNNLKNKYNEQLTLEFMGGFPSTSLSIKLLTKYDIHLGIEY